jgi:phospholipid transport system substrate-binding protein
MHPARYVCAVVAAAALAAAGLPAEAGAPTDQLRGSVDRVIEILEDPALKSEARTQERRTALRQVADQTFDFRETAKRALGRHWQALSDRERDEFTALFADLLERAYVSRIEQYSGERIAYNGEVVDPGGSVATVRSRFSLKSGTDVPVEYRMLKRGDRWLVYDVSVEGISLVANYRSQFNKVIETSSYGELVKRIKARGDEFRGPAAQPPAKKRS